MDQRTPTIGGSLTALLDDIDDWCGTGRKPGFPPRPHGMRDLFLAIAIGELAAQIGNAEIRQETGHLASNLIGVATKQVGAHT